MARFAERLVLMVLAFSTYFLIISCTESVPVVLWQQHSGDNYEQLSSNSLVYSLTKDEFVNDVLKKFSFQQGPFVLFTYKKISLEDFTCFGNAHNESENSSFKNLQRILKNNPASMLPSVEYPVEAVKEYASGRKMFELNNADELPDGLDNSLLIFRFPDGKDRQLLLEKNDEKLGKIVEALTNRFSTFTAIFTGESSSWVEPEIHRVERHILSAEPAASHFYLNTSCFVIYFENVTLNYYQYDSSTNGRPLLLQNDTVSPNSFEDKSPVDCTANSTQIVLNYKSDANSVFPVALITMTFEQKARNDWYLTDFNLSYTVNNGSTQAQGSDLLIVKDIWAPMGFSYHCSPSNFKKDLYNLNNSNFAEVYFQNFQVQPFNSTNGVFGDPWDCVGFFTIGIWMAIFTIAILIIVLGFGIYISFIIKTMDRFDDPKGKTISVTATD